MSIFINHELKTDNSYDFIITIIIITEMNSWVTIPKKHQYVPVKKSCIMHIEYHDYCHESGLIHFVVFCLRNKIPKDIRRLIYLLIVKNRDKGFFVKTVGVQAIGNQDANNWELDKNYGLTPIEQQDYCPNCHDFDHDSKTNNNKNNNNKNNVNLSILNSVYNGLYGGMSRGSQDTHYMSSLCRFCYVLLLKGKNVRIERSYGRRLMCGTMKNIDVEKYLCGCEKVYTKKNINTRRCSKKCKVLL